MIAGSVNGYHYSVGADGTGIKILCSSAVRKTQQRSGVTGFFGKKETLILETGVEFLPNITEKEMGFRNPIRGESAS